MTNEVPAFRRPSERVRENSRNSLGKGVRDSAFGASLSPVAVNTIHIIPHNQTDGYVLAIGNVLISEIDEPGSDHVLAQFGFPWAFHVSRDVARQLAQALLQQIAADEQEPKTTEGEGEGK